MADVHGGLGPFLALGAVAAAAVALWLLARPLMAPACANPPDQAEPKLAAL
jgi:hypothetical protein